MLFHKFCKVVLQKLLKNGENWSFSSHFPIKQRNGENGHFSACFDKQITKTHKITSKFCQMIKFLGKNLVPWDIIGVAGGCLSETAS